MRGYLERYENKKSVLLTTHVAFSCVQDLARSQIVRSIMVDALWQMVLRSAYADPLSSAPRLPNRFVGMTERHISTIVNWRGSHVGWRTESKWRIKNDAVSTFWSVSKNWMEDFLWACWLVTTSNLLLGFLSWSLFHIYLWHQYSSALSHVNQELSQVFAEVIWLIIFEIIFFIAPLKA